MTAVSIKYRKSRCIGETYGKYKMCIFCVFRGKYIKTPENKVVVQLSNKQKKFIHIYVCLDLSQPKFLLNFCIFE